MRSNPARYGVAPIAVVLTLLAGLGFGRADPAVAPVRTAPNLALAAQKQCQDAVVVGVDGQGQGWGGESSFGPVLRTFARSFERRARSAGSGVDLRHLGAKFADADRLAHRAALARAAEDAVTKKRARAWRFGVGAAIVDVSGELRSMASACPEQAYVLVGEAQGASVVHRLLRRLEGAAELEGRLVGATIVSDGDRSAHTRATLVGSPVAPARGQGVLTRVLSGAEDVPTAALDVRVVSVCSMGDIVCDLRGWSVRRSLDAHHSYDSRAGRKQLRSAAAKLWERASAWPRPIAGQVVLTHPDDAFSEQIRVRVGAPYAATTVFEDAQGLPPGVTLSQSGLLSGTVDRTGTWEVTHRVRNSVPATSSSVGRVTVISTSSGDGSAVNGGGQASCQVEQDGTASCVGDNSFGQLGDGTNVDRTNPVQVGSPGEWASISTSGVTSCGVRRTSNLFCWGANNRGQLGLGGGTQEWSPRRVGTTSRWAQVSASWLHTCAVKTTGTLWCWGENSEGQLGTGSRTSKLAPVRVGDDKDWASVAVGGWHTCGVRRDGSAWCWGRNDFGQLGIGSTAARLLPSRVDSQLEWRSLDATWSSTCGLASSARILCWGMNDQGQLGDGSRSHRRSPATVPGDHQWSSVSVGDSHACGLDNLGAAFCWGSNRYGQLGNGTETSTREPTQVAGERTWMAIDAGWLHSCGLSLRDAMQCWGNNERGQLGRGDRVNRTTPPGVSVPAFRQPARRLDPVVVMMSFNVLGSQHTAPGGGARTYAPGRIRSEWVTNLLQNRGAGVVAFQELQVDQFTDLGRTVGDTYSFYPGDAGNPRVVWQSIMWETSQWELVASKNISVPFNGKTRPNTMVRLHSLATDKDIWVFNAHNPSRNTPERQRERNEAVRIEIAEILTKREKRIPVVFLGDMNERERVFCKVTGQTDLEAASGGSYTGGECTPPPRMHLDWIFASPEFGVRNHAFLRTPAVRRITDHSVLTSRMRIPRP